MVARAVYSTIVPLSFNAVEIGALWEKNSSGRFLLVVNERAQWRREEEGDGGKKKELEAKDDGREMKGEGVVQARLTLLV